VGRNYRDCTPAVTRFAIGRFDAPGLLVRADARLEVNATVCIFIRFPSFEGDNIMPAKSASQQKAAGAALAVKRGDSPKSKLQGASKSMEDSMSEKQLEDLAHTKRKGKPEHNHK
jgi:hypothetical protein